MQPFQIHAINDCCSCSSAATESVYSSRTRYFLFKKWPQHHYLDTTSGGSKGGTIFVPFSVKKIIMCKRGGGNCPRCPPPLDLPLTMHDQSLYLCCACARVAWANNLHRVTAMTHEIRPFPPTSKSKHVK